MSLKARIGLHLRAIRNARGVTQEQLAGMTDRSVDAISAIERGVMAPSIETLERFAEAFSLPVTAFFVGATHKPDGRDAIIATIVANAYDLSDRDLEVAAAQITALARSK
ncbi:MAG: helix-turn-helix transcriptional regulator [Phenylobacterium sp.]|nr:helix-turn-helix transcriptional regulator [Phenylobacterium sp.]MBX3485789.1 helix-turn-helix transcriptional regulator [Phenylobacterium sp.]MCW5760142.1 helix-turn-helix transcriptional regulator [Phenylobacterium sp.]